MTVWDAAAIEFGRKGTHHSQALLRALSQPIRDFHWQTVIATLRIEDGCTASEHLAKHHGVSKSNEIIDHIKNRQPFLSCMHGEELFIVSIKVS